MGNRRNLLCVILVALACRSGYGQEWGSITGQFVLGGKIPELKPLVVAGDSTIKDSAVCSVVDVPDESLVVDRQTSGIAHIAVYLVKAPARIHPDLQPVPEVEASVGTQGCRFVPHVMVVRTQQCIRFSPQKDVGHNFHFSPFANTPNGFILEPTQDLRLTFKLPETRPIKFQCDIHSCMQGWLLVVDHPYAAFTNVHGKFAIENLPVGKHEFRVWHERIGWINRGWSIDVQSGENNLPPQTVPLEKFGLQE